MRYLTNNCIGIVFALIALNALAKPPHASPEDILSNYRAALLRDYPWTLSGTFLLVRIERADTGEVREFATLSVFLLGALMYEYDLQKDKDMSDKAHAMAIESQDRHFRLTKLNAIENVWPIYSEEDLTFVREKTSELTNEQIALIVDFSANSNLFSISREYRMALAHVLLERGLLPGQGHHTHPLYIIQ